MKPKIGFIGLGLMGRPMVLNLLKAGFPVTVWNRTRSKSEELAKSGATVANTAADAAAQADVLITIVSDPAALESVLWGEGALAALRKGSLLIDSSTVSPALAKRVAGGLRGTRRGISRRSRDRRNLGSGKRRTCFHGGRRSCIRLAR